MNKPWKNRKGIFFVVAPSGFVQLWCVLERIENISSPFTDSSSVLKECVSAIQRVSSSKCRHRNDRNTTQILFKVLGLSDAACLWKDGFRLDPEKPFPDLQQSSSTRNLAITSTKFTNPGDSRNMVNWWFTHSRPPRGVSNGFWGSLILQGVPIGRLLLPKPILKVVQGCNPTIIPWNTARKCHGIPQYTTIYLDCPFRSEHFHANPRFWNANATFFKPWKPPDTLLRGA